MEKFITIGTEQTRKMGEMLAEELKDGASSHPIRGEKIICLEGELGSGKTTFAQGILKGLKIKGPYTSPTFVIMKQYQFIKHNLQPTKKNKKADKKLRITSYKLRDVYHIDAYRVNSKDILELGWEEIIRKKNNVIIIEWADRIKKIIPAGAVWIKFKWIDKNKRRITILNNN